jgi:signal transduction histidine kinase
MANNAKVLREGSAVFRPRARIIQTIGKDLISNELIAIQELIKNAYDADATAVKLIFEDPLERGQGAINIVDNGCGMTFATVRDSWMEPATVSKVKDTVTPRGRRVTGEKGIGRFAAARVAQSLAMTTRPVDGDVEIYAEFDWGAFEDHTRYLDEILCSWKVRQRPRGTSSGTTFRLSGLNNDWDEDEDRDIHSFSNLRSELSRLVAPIGDDEFTVDLVLPDRFKRFAGKITPPPLLGHPRYSLHGQMDANGFLDLRYEGPDETGQILDAHGKKPQVLLSGGKMPRCGPFQIELRVWDRDDLDSLAEELGSTVRDIRKDLNAASGINIYRNHFRVLLPQTDWLRLDLRRVQNPTLRLSNNQIVGRVFISADANPGLKDQTNRQGIVDSPQYEAFRLALMDILARLEAKRDNFRRAQRVREDGPGIFQKLQLAPVSEYVVKRYPNDLELKTFLEQKEKTFDEGIGEVQRVLARYRRLATLGQLIDVVLHEGREPVSTIGNQVELLRLESADSSNKKQGKFFKRIHTIERQVEVLKHLFERLAPFSGRKRGRPANIVIEEVIANVFEIMQAELNKMKVEISLPTSSTNMIADSSEFQTMILNLLTNSLYWLEKVPSDRKIQVQVTSNDSYKAEIVFSDSGPGIPEDSRDRIFDPYFSLRPDGVGLGLTIAGETAAEYDGSLELLDKGPLPGATFRIRLRNLSVN